MKSLSIASLPRATLIAASLALAPAVALGADQQAGAVSEDVTIGGDAAMKAGELVGQPVMMNGERIGQVADLIGRENTYNDVVIRLDRAHSQMGVILGAEGAMQGNQRPVIVGGHTVAVPAGSLTRAEEGEGLMLSESAVTSLDQFRATGGQDFFTYTQGQTAELPDYGMN